MMPVLFSFGPVQVYAYGMFLVLGVVLGMYVCWKKAREYHIESDVFFDMVFRALVWGVVIGRIVYVLWGFDNFGMSPIKWLWLTYYPGIDMWGAMAGGVASLWWSSRKQNLSLSVVGDLMSLGAAFAIACGWIGAFLNGSPLSVSLPRFNMYFGSVGQWMFPAQILFFLAFLLLVYGLWYLEPRYRTFEWYRKGKSGAKTGFLSAVFLCVFGLLGVVSRLFFVERRVVWGLDWDMVLAASAFLAGVMIFLVQSGRVSFDRFKRSKVVGGLFK